MGEQTFKPAEIGTPALGAVPPKPATDNPPEPPAGGPSPTTPPDEAAAQHGRSD